MKSRLIFTAISIFVIAGSLLLDSCKKTDVSVRATIIPFNVPAGFPAPVFDFSRSPITQEGFQLGRKLFHDGRLSIDGNYPCSSCHQQLAAFTTFEHDRSHGINNSHTLRNAPSLSNLAWIPIFNQDGSAATLDDVFRSHITHTNEMGENVSRVVDKLKADTAYQRLFRAAFGQKNISAELMFDALSQYVLNLVSADSKYDKVMKGQAAFSVQEQQGYTVFQAKCASCHKEPLFTDYSFRNIGLEIDPDLKDYGRMQVTGNKNDSLKFRVPSLRNLEFTSYYSHDGRFSFPRMMLQHYRFGVKQSSTLDPLLVNGISLTNAEEDAIVAFLRTLSDSTFLNNPNYKE
ncbi:MAG TPA: cytochrome-c peroxidase [Flavisolibacter sp.]|nr:cytochrome-c peroxidase [Flavisolibacter sp.]